MNTLKDLRTLLNLAIGCTICLFVAALGLYPFADNRRGREHRLGAVIRHGFTLLLR
jgi:hypothetical protein